MVLDGWFDLPSVDVDKQLMERCKLPYRSKQLRV
jgi:hypothetical protein